MASFSELLMYLPGAVVFLVGSGQTRSWIRQLRGTDKTDGVVTSCEHVVKKDKKDRDVYNYFDVTVSYQNTETGKNEKEVFKSPTEYALGSRARRYPPRKPRVARRNFFRTRKGMICSKYFFDIPSLSQISDKDMNSSLGALAR